MRTPMSRAHRTAVSTATDPAPQPMAADDPFFSTGRSWRWQDLAWRLYERTPVVLEDAAKRCMPYILLCSTVRMPVAILRGRARHSGKPATMVVAGARPWADYLPYRFFAGAPDREVIAHVRAWALPSLLRWLAHSADITIVHVNRLSAALYFGQDYLVVPGGAGCRLPLPVDIKELGRASKSVKHDLQAIRRERLVSEISYSESDFELFYYTMHVPYVRKRHGEFAVALNIHQLRRIFYRGGILWVRRAEQRIAGILFAQRNNTFHAVSLGTANGDLELRKDGALAALYVSSIECAIDQGCTSLNFGGSPPVLNDGVLRYKRKWGVELGASQDPYDYVILWKTPNERVMEFLSHVPLVFRGRNGLSGVTTIEPDHEDSAAQLSTIHRALWVPGLQHLVVVTTSDREGDHRSTSGPLVALSPRHCVPHAIHAATREEFHHA